MNFTRSIPLLALLLASIAQAEAPRPRLFLTPQRLETLRKEVQTTGAQLWASLKAQADAIAASHPPAYLATPDLSGDQQNWQMPVGANMPYLATAYVLTKNSTYLAAAKQWALASCNYPTWGLRSYDGGDLAAGYQLLGLAIVYDWMYNDLDLETRGTIRGVLIKRARMMLDQSTKTYWRNYYLQNHQWVSMNGLTAAAFALMDDPEVANETKTWIAAALQKFRRVEELLGPDGASHEGLTYWSLGIDAILKFWDLTKGYTGENVTSKWWANTGYYRLYLSLPRHSWTRSNTVVDFADCIRSEWVGPDYLLHRLAAINHDGYIESLARETTPVSNCGGFAACWLNLIWQDPSIQPKSETTLPTLRHFADMEIVSARSDWSGDESLVAFKCGPGLGHNATNVLDYDAGSAHVHPDANHFVLFGNGEWLIRDDGYRFKGADDHNTLLIDGKGQLGEGGATLDNTRKVAVGSWFLATEELRLKSNPRITAAASKPAFDYMVGDAADAYPTESGLRRFVRQIVFVKPDMLIVADDIATDRPRDLELRFHPEHPSTAEGANMYVSRGAKAVLRVENLSPSGVEVTGGFTTARTMLPPARQRGLDKLEDPRGYYAIQIKTQRASWRNATAISWSPAGQQPAHVTLEKKDDGRWIFHTSHGAITLNWDGSEARKVE
jgi:hypothetical protein